ncbi:hypothetical protein [Picrophilus oshimae]|uniref:Uncharacterized protein n=1 Tax=Picrophilus torridus (strain ATCC 700027 / DSM 9790 / JCM 10055 / NBRC 100828 / KAW 2/3) TaxID=1122961 RepID=Q6L1K5_PICTO|nr:hypothetical protein [Picrophilus oshimae]AAT43147.1 hypothetical protein PTO0562 [Picrophilus oshimae DSM 9789]
MYAESVISFKNITVSVLNITSRRIYGSIGIENADGSRDDFKIIFSYDDDIDVDESTAGLILTMPVINYAYFSREITLNFDLSYEDKSLIERFIKINNHEVFINKIINRRYDFILNEYIPDDSDINEKNASGITVLNANARPNNKGFETNKNRVAIMSSGGKESLLGYGILNEIGAETYAFYFEESGSHWLTAKTAYDYYSRHFKNVFKIWSNVDRFYKFMNLKLKIIDKSKINIRADDYPIQVFIFPVYIFSMIPFMKKYGIGNIVMGDEFDDPREMKLFHGMKYYYGIFDQTVDFNDMMTDYFKSTGKDIDVYSIVYPITGSLEEKILMERYHDLFLNQRSCHSCHIKDGRILPCGKCTKCLGILLFILANNGDPGEIGYSNNDIRLLPRRLKKARLRLDPDEIKYTESRIGIINDNDYNHVAGIHIMPYENSILSKVPEMYRDNIFKIFNEYSSGIYKLNNNKWERIS